MRKPSYGLKNAIREHGFTPVKLPEGADYEVGKTYWNGYWQKFYKVIDKTPDLQTTKHGWGNVTVEWEDGKVGTHCTKLDVLRDWELVGGYLVYN